MSSSMVVSPGQKKWSNGQNFCRAVDPVTVRVPLACEGMKVRVRVPGGSTQKLDADPDDAVLSLLRRTIAASGLSSGGESTTAIFCLSLNKKTALDESASLRDCGVRGGDLLYMLEHGQENSESTASRKAAGTAGGSDARVEGTSASSKVEGAQGQMGSSAGAAEESAGVGATSPPSAPAAAPAGRNPFGLPSSAPVGSVQASGERPPAMVIDGRGIVWEESVRYTGERGREDVDRMRVEAVRQRTTNSRSKEQGGGGIGVVAEDGATRGSGSRMSGQGAAASVQVMVDQVARREGLNDLSKGDVCVLGIHCLLSDKGFGDDELPTRWREGNGNYVLRYRARVDGKGGHLTLKAVQILDRLMVYLFVGQGRARIGMPIRTTDYTHVEGQGVRLTGGGEALRETLIGCVFGQLEKQSVEPMSDDDDMQDMSAEILAQGSGGVFVGLGDQRRFHSAFREGLATASSMVSGGEVVLDSADILVLGVHVLFCCAGLVPIGTRPSTPPEGGEVGVAEGTCKPDAPLPVPLESAISGLPPSWRGSKGSGCYSVRYCAPVEHAGGAPVLMKALVINGRLVLHAHVTGGRSVARCSVRIGEVVHKVGGVPVITDDGLEKMRQFCSKRLLSHVGRMIRQGEGKTAVGGGFGGLYAELKTHVLAHLPARALGNIACANRKLNSLAMNDLLWEVVIIRDFGLAFATEPVATKDGGDGTWRGTYCSLLQRRRKRRCAARNLFRVPFPLNPLAPWIPDMPLPYGGGIQPHWGGGGGGVHFDPRFPMPWMAGQQESPAMDQQQRDTLRGSMLPRVVLHGSPHPASTVKHTGHGPAAAGSPGGGQALGGGVEAHVEALVPSRGAAMLLGVRGAGVCLFTAGVGFSGGHF